MKVKDHLKFCRFQYLSSLNPTKFVLGDVVTITDNRKQVGVVIQIHDDGDIRTDMFGNYHIDGLRLSTLDEVKEYYPKILNELVLEKEYKDKVKVYHVYETEDDVLLTGTIKDVIKWAKDQWKYNDAPNGMIKDILNVEVEEDYYYEVDNSLLTVLPKLGYEMVVACEVPIEDFE
jgi:hypothetical protein